MNIVDQFENELFEMIETYSGVDLTKAEAIGVLEIAKQRIITKGLEDEK